MKQLAESRNFQRLALRIDSYLTAQKNTIKNVSSEYIKTGTEVLKNAPKPQGIVGGFDINKFAKAFKEEIKKDFKRP